MRMTLCFFVCCFSMACSTLRYHDNPPPVKGGREREGGREDPLVDVRYEDTANEHNWSSFPEPSCVHMLLSWRRPLSLGGPHTNTV